MKTIITLKDLPESKELLKNCDFDELKEELDFVYPSNLDITLKGNFFLSVSCGNLWIETESFILLRIPVQLIRDFIVKDSN